jgi:hypothetical protein
VHHFGTTILADDLVPEELWALLALLPARRVLHTTASIAPSRSQLRRRDRAHGPHVNDLAAAASR